MRLLVGLGNPDARYQKNRHNVGFRVADLLAERAGLALAPRFDGLFAKGALERLPVAILKPMTFMNRSGESVRAAASFFKLPPEDVVVVHDELDLEFGRLQIKKGGGHAGHNGLRSIAEDLGGQEFVRVRVGVGRPPPERDASSHVLSDFSQEEERALEELLQRATDAVVAMVVEGTDAAMNRFNRVNP
jgi:PTH1 family peptidyl-tRNA hydrolase